MTVQLRRSSTYRGSTVWAGRYHQNAGARASWQNWHWALVVRTNRSWPNATQLSPQSTVYSPAVFCQHRSKHLSNNQGLTCSDCYGSLANPPAIFRVYAIRCLWACTCTVVAVAAKHVHVFPAICTSSLATAAPSETLPSSPVHLAFYPR